MRNTPEFVLFDWLTKANFKVSRTYISDLVKSHPDYPSLLSITETLDFLGIANEAYVTDKEVLAEVPMPFLASTSGLSAELVVVTGKEELEALEPEFYKYWNGVVITIQRDPQWFDNENTRALAQDKSVSKKWLGLFVSIALVGIAACIIGFSWESGILSLISISGIGVSALIISKELGFENSLADKVCGGKGDCDTLGNSDNKRLPFGISWGDVGLVWFSMVFLGSALAAFVGLYQEFSELLSYPVAGSILFSGYSLYYQRFVSGKWCRLCLMVLGLLTAQTILLSLPHILGNSWGIPESATIFFFLTTGFIVGLGWGIIKTLLGDTKRKKALLYKGARIRRNTGFFSAIMDQQRNVDVSVWEDDIQLGNPYASLQMTVACNPFCRPCGELHEFLHELIRKKADKIGLRVRFAVNHLDKQDKRTRASALLLGLLAGYKFGNDSTKTRHYAGELLLSWFRIMNLELFSKRYPVSDAIDCGNILARHGEWAMKNGIVYTPALFINGREVPLQFDKEDVLWHISVLADNLFEGTTNLNRLDELIQSD